MKLKSSKQSHRLPPDKVDALRKHLYADTILVTLCGVFYVIDRCLPDNTIGDHQTVMMLSNLALSIFGMFSFNIGMTSIFIHVLYLLITWCLGHVIECLSELCPSVKVSPEPKFIKNKNSLVPLTPNLRPSRLSLNDPKLTAGLSRSTLSAQDASKSDIISVKVVVET